MRALSLILMLGALAIPVAGCGGGDDSSSSSGGGGSSGGTSSNASSGGASSSGGGGQTLNLAADPNGALKFDKTSLSAKAGKVTIVMTNKSSLPHAVAVEGNGVDKDGPTVTGSGTSKVTVNLKPGKYEFYCPVDGHKAAGMKGELTVS